ncbi:MAG: hypothetical protein AABW87_01845, partial [Nanoarchaeota archaeon]
MSSNDQRRKPRERKIGRPRLRLIERVSTQTEGISDAKPRLQPSDATVENITETGILSLDLPSRSMWDKGGYEEALRMKLSRMYGSELRSFEIIETSQDPSPSAYKGG